MRDTWTYTRFMPKSAPRTGGVQESELCSSGSQAFAPCVFGEMQSMGLTHDEVEALLQAPLADRVASTEDGITDSSRPQA